MSAGFCISIPKMIFSPRQEVKSSDFMRLSAVFSFAFSRTSKKRCGKRGGSFGSRDWEDSKPLPHPILRRHILFHIVFRGIHLGLLGGDEIPQRLEAAMASTRSWSMNSSAPVNVSRMAHSTSTLLRQHLETVSQRSRSIRPCRPITFRIPGQQPVIGRYGSSRGGCLFPIRQDSNPSPPTRITNQQHGKSRHNTSCEHKNVSVRIFPISFRVPPPLGRFGFA